MSKKDDCVNDKTITRNVSASKYNVFYCRININDRKRKEMEILNKVCKLISARYFFGIVNFGELEVFGVEI